MTSVEPAPGRPGAGTILTAQLAQSAQRRPARRDLSPLRRLTPYARSHAGDGALAGIFLLISSLATLGLTAGVRMIGDHGLTSDAALRRTMLAMGGIVAILACASALRFYFVTKLGERVVADLRKAVFDHVLSLDQAFFLKTRTVNGGAGRS